MKLDFFAFLCPEAKSLNILQWFHFWKTQILKAQRFFKICHSDIQDSW